MLTGEAIPIKDHSELFYSTRYTMAIQSPIQIWQTSKMCQQAVCDFIALDHSCDSDNVVSAHTIKYILLDVIHGLVTEDSVTPKNWKVLIGKSNQWWTASPGIQFIIFLFDEIFFIC